MKTEWTQGWRRASLPVLLVAAFSCAASAQEKADAPPGPPSFAPAVVANASDKLLTLADMPKPRRFVTRHKAIVRGKGLAYTATAGETYITNLQDEPIASIFSFAYVAHGKGENRPVLFIFNGGPGSASIWLHMGAVGPKRVVLDREVNPSNTPPFGLRDNPYSVLDVADLVFIDPVGTGFSRAVGHAKERDFFNVDADAESVARFIELWLTQNGRWNSPKYLMGESYGSIRAAVLPRALMGGPTYMGVMRGITVDGVILVGPALGGTKDETPDGPNPRVGLSLPSLAVTAWYHGKIDRNAWAIPALYDEVKRFGATTYADALHRLDKGQLPAAELASVAAQLEAFTGIPARTWTSGGLRLANGPFLKQLLADEGLEAGAYDSRYTLPLANGGGEPVADDPAMGRYVPGFVAAFHQMLADVLKVDMKLPYHSIRWEGLNFVWNYDRRIGPPVAGGYAGELAIAMRRNPKLRLLVAAGYYDMVTTPAAAEYAVRQGNIPADRTSFRNYESGHMLYLGDTAGAFADDVRAFVSARP